MKCSEKDYIFATKIWNLDIVENFLIDFEIQRTGIQKSNFP
jgi:hypothetical protein